MLKPNASRFAFSHQPNANRRQIYIKVSKKSLGNLFKSWKIHPKSVQKPFQIYEKSMKILFWIVLGRRSPLRPRLVLVDFPHCF